MTGVIIRPSTTAELALIRSAWCKTFNPSAARGDMRDGLMLWGENRRVAPTLARRMMRWLVDSRATEETVLVLDVDGQPLSTLCRELVERDGEPLFVAMPFVYTIAKARRRGLASELVRYVKAEADALGVPLKPTMMTPNGTALKRAFDG